jgi:hypothetical protein
MVKKSRQGTLMKLKTELHVSPCWPIETVTYPKGQTTFNKMSSNILKFNKFFRKQNTELETSIMSRMFKR